MERERHRDQGLPDRLGCATIALSVMVHGWGAKGADVWHHREL